MYQSLLKSLNRLNPRAWDFIQLTRMDKPIGIYLLLWPTLWALWIAGKGSPSLANIVIFVFGVVLTRAGGLRDQRLGRPQGRRPCETHRTAPTGERQDQLQGGAGVLCGC